jgi:cytochrome b6
MGVAQSEERDSTRRPPWAERLGLTALQSLLAHKGVPVHSASIWYYLGGVTLFLFFVQVVTGCLLMLYYRPTPSEAYESVQFIMTRVEFGWLIRSVHCWSANLMVLTAMVHMFSVVFLHGYRRPRGMTWMSGIGLLALVLAFGFSGYLLPWNTTSYFATKVGTDIAATTPVAGPLLGQLLRGGEGVGGATLTRFFAFHVTLLPLLTIALLAVHLGLVQRFGMSVPPWVESKSRQQGRGISTMPFVPNFVLRELIVWYSAIGVLALFAVLLPWDLGDKADLFAPAPAGIRPEWYFLALFYTLKLVPGHVLGMAGEVIAVMGFTLLAVLWAALPLWAQNKAGSPRVRLVTGVGVGMLVYLITFTVLGYLR